MSLDDFLDKIAIRRNFVLTPLRREILTIMFNHSGCMKAYDIVTQLNNIRSDTKPIIVYRVLNFLVVNKVLHKISSKNIFMLCADFCSVAHKVNTIFLICDNCSAVKEIYDIHFMQQLKNLYAQFNFNIKNEHIELIGICDACA